jgi:hypothetical protein
VCAHTPQSLDTVARTGRVRTNVRSPGQNVWIVGDAIINLDWLKAWAFWPVNYTTAEIIQTSITVATILSLADLIVPRHSAPVAIDASLTGELLSTFPAAAHANRCDHVRQLLSDRSEQLQADARPASPSRSVSIPDLSWLAERSGRLGASTGSGDELPVAQFVHYIFLDPHCWIVRDDEHGDLLLIHPSAKGIQYLRSCLRIQLPGRLIQSRHQVEGSGFPRCGPTPNLISLPMGPWCAAWGL